MQVLSENRECWMCQHLKDDTNHATHDICTGNDGALQDYNFNAILYVRRDESCRYCDQYEQIDTGTIIATIGEEEFYVICGESVPGDLANLVAGRDFPGSLHAPRRVA